MKKQLFFISFFISNSIMGGLSSQYEEIHKEAHKIFEMGNYIGAIHLCTPIIENLETSKKDLLYFLLARSLFYMGRPEGFEDRKTIINLYKEYAEVREEYEYIINPINYIK